MSRLARRPVASRRKGRQTAASSAAPERPLKIGEAAEVLGVKPYVLRFWETEFPSLRPNHTASRHRLYTPKDIEALRLIKRLLYEEGFTIEGARRRIRELGYGARVEKGDAETAAAEKIAPDTASPPSAPPADGSRQALADIRRDLQSLYELLKN